MQGNAIRTLLVGEGPNDVALALHALRRNKLVNDVEVARSQAWTHREAAPVKSVWAPGGPS